MRNSTRATLSVVAVACLLFGLASIGLGAPFFWSNYKVVRTWPATTASIKKSEVVQVTVGGEKQWATRFELSFVVGDHLYPVVMNGYRQGAIRENVELAANRFPQGKSVLIRYNPQNPFEVRLDTDNPRRYYQVPIAMGITGGVFCLVAFVLFWVGRKLG